MSKDEYTPTIGIECHVQLKTKTKLFSAVGNDARDAAPNTLISHIDVGMPGALPVLNEHAVELASRAAFALNTKPQKISYFERKHYFYPDLPMGYQISQLHQPIIVGGSLEIEVEGQKMTIHINRAQLEADAGKNTHPEGVDYSLVDLNRAGTPLLEIVSEPELHSAAQAKAYARELWLNMKYAGVTDGDLYHGHTRFDVNVSVSNDPNKLGIRAEIKNLNSFRSVEGAIEYEIKRQAELLEKGQPVIQETRGWDEAKQKTLSQREKEEAHDYRYFPDPDLPPVELEDAYIENVNSHLSELPSVIRVKLAKLNIGKQVIEDILDKSDIVPVILKAIEIMSPEHARGIAFRMLGIPEELKIKISEHVVVREKVISEMLDNNELSSTSAKQISLQSLKTGRDPRELAEEMNLMQVSDETEIEKIVAEVLSENAKAAEDIKKGETKAIGFLVGQVMKKSQGKANPQLAQQLIKKQLEVL
jgi:aspartyl-tRNA(Asn)/glutamyl-tRNA(Gln) amidotransferase subunit B